MNDPALYNQWIFWLIIATVLILAAATLLILVIVKARRILRLAKAALGLVIEIKKNTLPIWELQQTNAVACDILETAKDINSHINLVGDALHEKEVEPQ